MTQVLSEPGMDGVEDPFVEPAVDLPLTKVGRDSIWASRELILNLTRREVSGKYKRTTFGHLWSLLNPLSTMLVYTLVFSVILKAQPDRGDPSGLKVYALFLMCALVPWSFFNNSVTSGMTALLNNAGLVTKVYFRRDVLVAAAVGALMVTFGFEMLVLVIALLAFGGMPLPWLPLVMAMMLLLALFGLGVALLLSVANTYFRDTQHFVSIAFSLWFYLTPVIYPYSRLAAHLNRKVAGVKLSTVYNLNPMTRFVDVFRALLYDNRFPAWGDVAFCAGVSLFALLVGGIVFSRFEPRLAEEM